MYWRFFPPRCYTTTTLFTLQTLTNDEKLSKKFRQQQCANAHTRSPTQYNADFFQILNLALDTLDFNFIRLLRCIHSLYLNNISTINNDLYYYNSSNTYVKVVYANYTIILLHNFEYILHITIWIILYNQYKAALRIFQFYILKPSLCPK